MILPVLIMALWIGDSPTDTNTHGRTRIYSKDTKTQLLVCVLMKGGGVGSGHGRCIGEDAGRVLGRLAKSRPAASVDRATPLRAWYLSYISMCTGIQRRVVGQLDLPTTSVTTGTGV
jgi:hypothetical protein